MKIMTCKKCGEDFELRPNKRGFANVCEDCTGLRNVTTPAIRRAPRSKAKIKFETFVPIAPARVAPIL